MRPQRFVLCFLLVPLFLGGTMAPADPIAVSGSAADLQPVPSSRPAAQARTADLFGTVGPIETTGVTIGPVYFPSESPGGVVLRFCVRDVTGTFEYELREPAAPDSGSARLRLQKRPNR